MLSRHLAEIIRKHSRDHGAHVIRFAEASKRSNPRLWGTHLRHHGVQVGLDQVIVAVESWVAWVKHARLARYAKYRVHEGVFSPTLRFFTFFRQPMEHLL